MPDDSSEMQRLRLEQAARTKNFEARIAEEALAQFKERQRHTVEAELATCKRKIQELEAVQPRKKLKHTRVPGKFDQSLQSLGFGGGQETQFAFFVPPGAAIGVSPQYAHVRLICSFIKTLKRFADM